MDLIDSFISHYMREFDFYDQVARLAELQLRVSLQQAGIRAIVTSRAKSVDRLEDKVRQRNEKEKYKTLADIYNDIVDLAGVRVALYFPGERDQVGKIIGNLFSMATEPKEFSGDSPPIESSIPDKRFAGYFATHYRVKLQSESLDDTQQRYTSSLVEIQVASVFMHAWAEVEHDLVYKPLRGELSDQEHKILDQLNGIALAGESALELLQAALENRLAKYNQPFTNHYELAAYLLENSKNLFVGEASDAVLGRIDRLFLLLVELDLAYPAGLAPYLNDLKDVTEGRPLADQLIERLVTDKDRYSLYFQIRDERDRRNQFQITRGHVDRSDVDDVIGRFVNTWISFEERLRDLVNSRMQRSYRGMPPVSAITESQLFSGATLETIDYLRKFRNNLIHGIEIPEPDFINRMTERLEELLKSPEFDSDAGRGDSGDD